MTGDDLAGQIAGIWGDVLKRGAVGPQENFFADLGGTSLDASRALAVLGRSLGRRVPLSALLRHPTPQSLAAELGGTGAGTAASAVPEPSSVAALLPSQQWYVTTPVDNTVNFTVEVLLAIPSGTDAERLGRAVQHLLRRHPALRARIGSDEAGWTCTALPAESVPAFESVELGPAQPDPEWLQRRVDETAERIRADLDPWTGQVFRVVHLSVPGHPDDYLLIIAHHFVCDGFSFEALTQDLETTFAEGYGDGVDDPRPRPPGMLWWAERLARYAESAQSEPERAHWKARRPTGRSPLLLPAPDHRNGGCADTRQSLTEAQSQRFSARADQLGISENALALACATWSYLEVAGTDAVVFNSLRHGRDLEFDGHTCAESVGWFSYSVPYVAGREEAASFADFARSLARELEQVPMHGVGNMAFTHGAGPDPEVGAICARLREDVAITANFYAFAEDGPAGPGWRDAPVQATVQPGISRTTRLALTCGREENGALGFSWTANLDYFDGDRVRQLMKAFAETVREVPGHSGR